MHFKNPEILYFLFLLIIPILIHLFQLRRFETEYFTNVRFLKQLNSQTRKSSTLKKWLLLFTRMLLLTFLIFAFAQPYFSDKPNTTTANEYVLVLDNSFSMQSKGEKGDLLVAVVQEIIEQVPANQKVSVITIDAEYWDVELQTIKNELLQIKPTYQSFDMQQITERIARHQPHVTKEVVIFTDAKEVDFKAIQSKPELIFPKMRMFKHQLNSNVSIDSVSVEVLSDAFYTLKIQASCYGELVKSMPLAVYDGPSAIAKTTLSFTKPTQEITLTISKKPIQGRVSVQDDNGLPYDNDYYFSIPTIKKRKVWCIGALAKSDFISRIYTSDEFLLEKFSVENINYNEIQKQDVIVLNELSDIPVSLQKTLQAFVAKGGVLITIPSPTIQIQSWNTLLKSLGSFQFTEPMQATKQVSKINYDHPLLKTVFDKRVSNFDYPKATMTYGSKGFTSSVLDYSDGSSFLSSLSYEFGRVYVFTAPLDSPISNFKNSPLIVPVFYTMGVSETSDILAFKVGDTKSMLVEAQLSSNQMLELVQNEQRYIPVQQLQANKVKLSFYDYPRVAGNYQIQNKQERIQPISFNYSRTESDLFQSEANLDIDQIDDLYMVLQDFSGNRTDTALWRWLLILTLVFLGIEIWIQKFFK